MTSLLEILYQVVPTPPEVANYQNALGKLYKNGEVVTLLFEAIDKEKYEEALAGARDAGPHCELISFVHWLSKSDIGEKLKISKVPDFIDMGGFSCEGFLTEILCFGGAYSRMDNEIGAARFLSYSCMQSLFGDSLHKLRAYVTHDIWCSWFRDSGWDVTVFVNDYVAGRWWLLCATDYD